MRAWGWQNSHERLGNFSGSHFCGANILFWSTACLFACIWAYCEAVSIACHSWRHCPHKSLPDLPYLWHLWLPFKFQSVLLVVLWTIYVRLIFATRKLKLRLIKYSLCCFISQRNQWLCYLLELIRKADFQATPHTSRITICTWTRSTRGVTFTYSLTSSHILSSHALDACFPKKDPARMHVHIWNIISFSLILSSFIQPYYGLLTLNRNGGRALADRQKEHMFCSIEDKPKSRHRVVSVLWLG